ncbi:hypothetical protein NXX77_20815 [Phocaeicola dorei]|nr:hypothetical protein [Phocaeicola dorei]
MTLQIRAKSVICCSVKNNATLGMAKTTMNRTNNRCGSQHH